MRWAVTLGLAVLVACGRIGFDPVEETGGGDGGADGAVALRCPTGGAGTVALYTFDGEGADAVRDSVGGHDGTVVGDVTFGTGPEGCGNAAEFAGAGYIEVADAPAWDLEVGAVDFWVRFPPGVSDGLGIVSRDAVGWDTGGHLTLWLAERRPVVRIQAMNGAQVAIRCGEEVLVPDVWHHVGINLGAPDVELWVDGVEQRWVGVATADDGSSILDLDCNDAPASEGIDGNDNPWVLGGSTVISDERSATPNNMPLTGAVDHLRVSSVRRDFTMP